ncbi:TadE/TadG family type IV pilus assembly protein [Altericroceibacterium endophyticum]|uniref:TadE-like domain-containing protein n=1 Tax=Altericroceibacterium endophyticum TaxID=1808508 RepID=A0A6I4T504_9SPHN|nr:TadE/TadG family type IV pilus assembly protein [Altericroceibacterium endophyticum]MXO65133.1 hypothetical protein [Altericroceibacterium endophyticum]
MQKFLRKLRSDEKGAALVEFALYTTLFFLAALPALDFGAFYLERSKLDEAVSAGSMVAFRNADSVAFDDLPNQVRALAEDANLTVTLKCNGVSGSCTNFSRSCSCLKTDGSYQPTGACGEPCGGGATGGSTSGYYLTIEARSSYEPLVLPGSVLSDTDLQREATVRLQ